MITFLIQNDRYNSIKVSKKFLSLNTSNCYLLILEFSIYSQKRFCINSIVKVIENTENYSRKKYQMV